MGQEMSEESRPLDVQTITNDQLLENTLLMKPSAYSLTHLRADDAEKSPLVFKNQVSPVYKCSFPVAPLLYPSGMFCWACCGLAPRKALPRHNSPPSTGHLLSVFTWFMATRWKDMCRCVCIYEQIIPYHWSKFLLTALMPTNVFFRLLRSSAAKIPTWHAFIIK